MGSLSTCDGDCVCLCYVWCQRSLVLTVLSSRKLTCNIYECARRIDEETISTHTAIRRVVVVALLIAEKINLDEYFSCTLRNAHASSGRCFEIEHSEMECGKFTARTCIFWKSAAKEFVSILIVMGCVAAFLVVDVVSSPKQTIFVKRFERSFSQNYLSIWIPFSFEIKMNGKSSDGDSSDATSWKTEILQRCHCRRARRLEKQICE